LPHIFLLVAVAILANNYRYSAAFIVSNLASKSGASSPTCSSLLHPLSGFSLWRK